MDNYFVRFYEDFEDEYTHGQIIELHSVDQLFELLNYIHGTKITVHQSKCVLDFS